MAAMMTDGAAASSHQQPSFTSASSWPAPQPAYPCWCEPGFRAPAGDPPACQVLIGIHGLHGHACLCYVSFLQRLEPGQDHSDTMSCLTGDGRKPAQGAPQAA